ncbi:MAG: alpha/beta fold hydrolase [Thermoguttaceae bacterium]|nr:alpha/beta fold hydrolase [Thermoguttaceae bacterium]
MNNWRALYPFESRFAEIGGHRYHYLDEGRGPVLLLVHGNPTWTFLWRDVIKGLRDRYRVIAVDHIGCGMSDKPSPDRYPYTLARRIEDLCRFVEQLDLCDVSLVAHDWGGAIGMGAAIEIPDRFRRFVLMNTAAFRAQRCPRRIRLCHVPFLGQVAVQGFNLFIRAALRQAAEKPLADPVREGLAAPYDSWGNRVAIYRFVCDIPLDPRHTSYSTLLRMEQEIGRFREHPVCLIWGMRDWCFTPDFLQRFIEIFPAAEVHRLPDAGHYLIEDAPELVVPLIGDFFARHAI